jgi:hypothetical protein
MAQNKPKKEKKETTEVQPAAQEVVEVPSPALEAMDKEIALVIKEIDNAQRMHRERVTEMIMDDPRCARISGALEAFGERLETLKRLKGIIETQEKMKPPKK